MLTSTVLLSLVLSPAQVDPDLILTGELAADALPYVEIPFEVPSGVVELAVEHDDGSEANILDWGLMDPSGTFRGWGGGNTEPAVVGTDAASRSYLPGPVLEGTWSLLIGQALIAQPPAAYEARIFFRDVAELVPAAGDVPYDFARSVSDTPGWYAGDFHVHSLDSGDATASLDDIGSFALEQGLDFVVITDHNTTRHFDQLGAAMDRHPSMLFIPGIEVTTYQGHLGLIGARAWTDFRVQGDRTLADLIADADAQGALLSVNHPALDLGDSCIGCAFDLLGSRSGIAGVEVQTGANRLFTPQALAFWDDSFEEGARPAALGGSDDHRAGQDLGLGQSPIGSPTTMVEADALSADGILAGVRAGRTVVKITGPDGPMVVLDADGRTGSEVLAEPGSAASVTAQVEGADGLDFFWVVDGVLEEAVTVSGDSAALERSIAIGSRVRAELWSGDSPVTITSHLFVSESSAVDPMPTCTCVGQAVSAPLGSIVLVGWGAILLRRGPRRRNSGANNSALR